ncbi:MAG TPA: PAS domain-containing protein [Bacteroidales bacterium]|nr:PAS domain-containing protein [Bacteroidales bacterium]
MNRSAEDNAMIAPKKLLMVVFNPRSWSIKWKARFNFLIRAIVAIGLLLLLVNLLQRRIVLREAADKLSLLSQTKSQYIDDYFEGLTRQLRVFASDARNVDAFTQFNESFLNIENDNYLSSSVTGLDRLNTLVEGYYKTEIAGALDIENATNVKALLPNDTKQRIFQYLYIAANPKPFGLKGAMNKAEDGSTYSSVHATVHPEMISFARQAGVSDILFVDYKTGYVIYSLKKNLDFATNLFEGPYKNSGLGMAFKNAVALQQSGEIAYTDASVYAPSLYKSESFISTPVFSGSQLLGAIVFAVDDNTLDRLVAYDHETTGTTASLKSIIIGTDFLYRNNDPQYATNKEKYTARLKKHSSVSQMAADVKRYGSTSMVQGVDPETFSKLIRGEQGLINYRTETGEEVLCSYIPLHIGDLNWMLLTQVDQSDALASLHRFMVILVFITLGIALILAYLSGMINKSITGRLAKIKNTVASLTRGESIDTLNLDSEDEIGFISNSVDILNERLKNTASYINELSKGNIDEPFPVSGEKDEYGHTLNKVRESLIMRRLDEEKRAIEDEIRNWTTQGIAMFNDILRMDTGDLEKLSLNIIRNIVQYLSANQGGLFLTEEYDEGRQHLKLVAAYAYDRVKYLNKIVEAGDGLIGNCLLEKKTILTNKLPADYMNITSGLGGSKAKCLLIVPLKKDEEVLGVLEVASFEDFKPHEVEFLEKIAESIAAALITVKLHLQTTQYLERFQQQTEEMKAQDEELRQNIEELQATHEQMERLKEEENERNQKIMKEMEDYRKLLISLINEIPEKIFLKDDEGRFVIANKPVADNYGRTVDEILGKSDFDFYPREEAEEYHRQEMDIIRSGKSQSYEEGDPSRYDGLIVRTVKKPFYIEHLGVTGLFGVQFDISDIKHKEFEATKMADEIKAKQKEIEEASVELMKEKALLDALLTSVPEHIYFKDKESRFLRFSKSMMKLFKVDKPEDLMGKSDFDFFSKEHAQPAYDGEQTIIRTGKAIIDLEEKNLMPDGSYTWVNTTKMPLRNANGEIIGTFGISKDITKIKRLQQDAIENAEELKAQEEELRQNLEEMQATQEDLRYQLEMNEKIQEDLNKEKALMDALMDNVPECIYFKDKDSKFIRFSNSMLTLFGLNKKEELLGKSDFDFFSDEHARPAFEDEQKIIRTGKAIIDLEEKEVLADGRFNWVNTTKMPLRDTEGNVIGTFGISKNISKIKNMEMDALEMTKAIEKNRKLLIDVLNKVPAKVFLKDENGKFIVVNDAVASVYNKRAEQIIGTSDYDNHPDEDVDSWRKQELEIIKKGETTYIHKENQQGKIRYLNTMKCPFVLATTGETGLLGIQVDVTDLKILEEEVQKLKTEIKKKV